MQIDDYLLTSLKTEIQKRFGGTVKNSAHCGRLATEIRDKLGVMLSAQTLRRFFGVVASKGGTSPYTLDALSQYCGYPGFEAFAQSQTREELDKFFGGTEDPSKNYWNRAEELCCKILESPELLTTAHNRLMKFPLAQVYFMELHPMRDMLCTVYAQYFQNYLAHKSTNEAKLFAYSFLFLGAYLSDNEEFLEIYYQKVSDTPATEEVFLIPAANKYGVTLLYAHLKKNKRLYTRTWRQMLEVRKRYIEQSKGSVCSFEYTVLEFLIFTDRAEDMRFLMENNTEQIYSDNGFVPQRRKECHDTVWKILCAVVLTKAGETEKAKNKIKNTDVEKLGCGWESYYAIIFHQTKKMLGLASNYNFEQAFAQTYLQQLPKLVYPGCGNESESLNLN